MRLRVSAASIAVLAAALAASGCGCQKKRKYGHIDGPFHMYEEFVSIEGCLTSRYYLVHIERDVVTEIAGPVLDRWAVHGNDVIIFYDRGFHDRAAGLYAYKHGTGTRVIALTPDFAWRSDADGISFDLTNPPPNPKMTWAQIEDLFRK